MQFVALVKRFSYFWLISTRTKKSTMVELIFGWVWTATLLWLIWAEPHRECLHNSDGHKWPKKSHWIKKFSQYSFCLWMNETMNFMMTHFYFVGVLRTNKRFFFPLPNIPQFLELKTSNLHQDEIIWTSGFFLTKKWDTVNVPSLQHFYFISISRRLYMSYQAKILSQRIKITGFKNRFTRLWASFRCFQNKRLGVVITFSPTWIRQYLITTYRRRLYLVSYQVERDMHEGSLWTSKFTGISIMGSWVSQIL